MAHLAGRVHVRRMGLRVFFMVMAGATNLPGFSIQERFVARNVTRVTIDTFHQPQRLMSVLTLLELCGFVFVTAHTKNTGLFGKMVFTAATVRLVTDGALAIHKRWVHASMIGFRIGQLLVTFATQIFFRRHRQPGRPARVRAVALETSRRSARLHLVNAKMAMGSRYGVCLIIVAVRTQIATRKTVLQRYPIVSHGVAGLALPGYERFVGVRGDRLLL